MHQVMARKQIPLYPSGLCCFQISELVSYKNAATDIHWKALQEIIDHSWCRLASRAYLTIPLYHRLGMVWAVFERVYASADLG